MYKAAIIGLGKIGLTYDLDLKRHAPSSHTLAYEMNPHFELAAAADVNLNQYEVLKRFAPGAQFFNDYRLMLSSQNYDVISICTPPSHHFETMEWILKECTTKVIFCEKPIVANIEEVRSLTQLLENRKIQIIPNLSRRWSTGMRGIYEHVRRGTYGKLIKIHGRYTRGIFNTGSHLFDLFSWFAEGINCVRVLEQVPTSSDADGDPSYSFRFEASCGASGYVEAFNDEEYYMFEIDLYFQKGKVEIRNSGDIIKYWRSAPHPLYSGFGLLEEESIEHGYLTKESLLANAINHLRQVLDGNDKSVCSIEDGLYPLFVAKALVRSAENQSIEKVVLIND
jgi:predicted dehydrogenase